MHVKKQYITDEVTESRGRVKGAESLDDFVSLLPKVIGTAHDVRLSVF